MIRITKYKFLFALAGLLVMASSCKKSYVDLLPPTSLLPDQALATEADIQVALRGAYAGFRATDFFGRTVPLLGDLMADNTYQSLTNTNRYTAFNLYNFTSADGNVAGFWTAAYNTILRANNIINASPKITNQANVNQYKGEAYAIRALCYFYLVQYFARPYTDDPNGAGVPIVLTYDANAKPARNTVKEVYTQILSDLTQATSLMTQFVNSSQFSKYAARGLQAKVYLTMGDKTNAKTAALDVINNSGFTLLSAANYVSFWSTLTPRTDKVETLFETSSDAINNQGFDALANIYNQAGYGDFLLSDEFFPVVAFNTPKNGTAAMGTANMSAGSITSVDIINGGSGYSTSASNTTPAVIFAAPPFGGTTATGTATLTGGSISAVTVTNPGTNYQQLLEPTDVRRGLYVTVNRGGIAGIAADKKYPGTYGSEISDPKIIRMSEMYLIAAEASLPGNEADALTYVNYLTSRRNASAIASTGAQLFEDIITERRKELALDGIRYLDLQRLKRDVVRSNDFPPSARSIPYSNFRRILPIPQQEINANPNIAQNPGY